MFKKGIFWIIITASLVIAMAQAVNATYDLAVAWCRSCEGEVSGYRIYKGWASGGYESPPMEIIGRDSCQAVISDLPVDQPVYLAVKAYDGEGNQSDFSKELIVHCKEDGTNLLDWIVMKGLPPYVDIDGLLGMTVFSGGESLALATSKIDLSLINKSLFLVDLTFRVMPTGTAPYFVFIISTKAGTRNVFIKFDPVFPAVGGTSNLVGAIWTSKRDGQWHTENLNLQSILSAIQPGNEIIKYISFLVYTYSPTAIAKLQLSNSPEEDPCPCP